MKPLVEALAPRAVWVCGEDELCGEVRDHAATLGYELVAEPGEGTDLSVISGDPNYYVVTSHLERSLAPGVGGAVGSPIHVVSGTGWPYGERDGYLDPEHVPTDHRRPYARCLADPDQVWLTAEPATLASALESGGDKNGVRPAVQTVADREGWRGWFFPGFGGLAILAPESRLTPGHPLTELLGRLAVSPEAQELLMRLDQELARGAIARARLTRALDDEQELNLELNQGLQTALSELDRELEEEASAVEILSDGLPRVSAALSASTQRAERLAQRVQEVEALAAATRAELSQERTWVALQARLIYHSQAWQIGHWIARTARLLTFRRHRGTDAVQAIVTRMERALDGDRS